MNSTPPLSLENEGAPTSKSVNYRVVDLPLFIALIIMLLGGIFLLNLADAQARDTVRKHHLEDLEQSLYFARNIHGTFPPYDQSNWCGLLNDPANSSTLSQIEEALRSQNEKYANPLKPFPEDPQTGLLTSGYFYWKRSPANFELYSILETDSNNERSTNNCNNAPELYYDYGLTSIWREK
jgi:hypothetical protein